MEGVWRECEGSVRGVWGECGGSAGGVWRECGWSVAGGCCDIINTFSFVFSSLLLLTGGRKEDQGCTR